MAADVYRIESAAEDRGAWQTSLRNLAGDIAELRQDVRRLFVTIPMAAVALVCSIVALIIAIIAIILVVQFVSTHSAAGLARRESALAAPRSVVPIVAAAPALFLAPAPAGLPPPLASLDQRPGAHSQEAP